MNLLLHRFSIDTTWMLSPPRRPSSLIRLRGDTSHKRRLASPSRGRSTSPPPPRRYRSPPRGSPRRISGSPVQRRSPLPLRVARKISRSHSPRRGAADYLIKPMRKNKLKNLWQHVSRRLTCRDDRTAHAHSLPASQQNNEDTDETSSDCRYHSDQGSGAQVLMILPKF